MFIAEDENRKDLIVNSPLGLSNTLLVDGVTSGFSSGLKLISKGAYYIGKH